MVRVFHCRSHDSALSEYNWSDLASVSTEPGWVWIDLSDPSQEELAYIDERYGVQPTSSELDPQRVSVDIGDDQFAVSIHGAVPSPQHQLITSEIRIIVTESSVVTIHAHNVVDSNAVIRRIQALDANEQTPGEVAAAVALDGLAAYQEDIKELDERVERVEDLAIEGEPTTLTLSQTIRRDAILLRRVIASQRDTVRRLADPLTPNLDPASRRSFADTGDELARMIESLDVTRGLLSSALETYRGAVAERTNETMKVLTVFSAILLPLALLSGIWGMNFSSIPLADQPHGFLSMMIAMSVVAIGVWIYFRRRGFIGGPRLRDIPRFVGMSLESLGSAPLRAATNLLKGPESTNQDE
ncbi:MAG: magnesium transporter CorA family protein [Acidimicrobiia bacterium]|nr:magnesium transporter CorA family protein [Acidimicrobiia bacterium]